MRISFEKPPIYDRAKEVFNLDESAVIFFAWEDTIYSPAGVMPSDDLIAHESVHAEQQQHDPTVARVWWERYFVDIPFRVEQEAEAHGAQYKFLCGRFKDRNKRSRILFSLASQMASSTYGNCISHSEASKKIKAYAEGTVMQGIEDLLE